MSLLFAENAPLLPIQDENKDFTSIAPMIPSISLCYSDDVLDILGWFYGRDTGTVLGKQIKYDKLEVEGWWQIEMDMFY